MSPNALHAAVIANIRIVRIGRGYSQSELARRVKKSPGYICDLERGRRCPNLATIAQVAAALDVDPAMLFLPLEPTKAQLLKKIRKIGLTACTALWYAGRRF